MVFWLGCCALCFGLGVWQVRRLAWKEELIRQASAKSRRLLPLSQLRDDPRLAFYRMRIVGRFEHPRAVKLMSKTHQGCLGWHVLTPLRVEGGREILVNRGWASSQSKPLESPTGPVVVEGILMSPGPPSFWIPESKPSAGVCYWVDLPAILPEGFQKLYLVAQRENDMSVKAQAPAGAQFPNNHLAYALTWFSLAGGLFIAGLCRIQPGRRRRTGRITPGPDF